MIFFKHGTNPSQIGSYLFEGKKLIVLFNGANKELSELDRNVVLIG